MLVYLQLLILIDILYFTILKLRIIIKEQHIFLHGFHDLDLLNQKMTMQNLQYMSYVPMHILRYIVHCDI